MLPGPRTAPASPLISRVSAQVSGPEAPKTRINPQSYPQRYPPPYPPSEPTQARTIRSLRPSVANLRRKQRVPPDRRTRRLKVRGPRPPERYSRITARLDAPHAGRCSIRRIGPLAGSAPSPAPVGTLPSDPGTKTFRQVHRLGRPGCGGANHSTQHVRAGVPAFRMRGRPITRWDVRTHHIRIRCRSLSSGCELPALTGANSAWGAPPLVRSTVDCGIKKPDVLRHVDRPDDCCADEGRPLRALDLLPAI